ncbi:MAG: hypothetical protein RIS36_954 [Pseudomonadota bacterium]|jgi:hypothetical protein
MLRTFLLSKVGWSEPKLREAVSALPEPSERSKQFELFRKVGMSDLQVRRDPTRGYEFRIVMLSGGGLFGEMHRDLEDVLVRLNDRFLAMRNLPSTGFCAVVRDNNYRHTLGLTIDSERCAPEHTTVAVLGIVEDDNGNRFEIILSDSPFHQRAVLPTDLIGRRHTTSRIAKRRFKRDPSELTQNHKSLGYSRATNEVHRAFLKHLLEKEKDGTINDAERYALNTSQKYPVENQEGVITFKDGTIAETSDRSNLVGSHQLYMRAIERDLTDQILDKIADITRDQDGRRFQTVLSLNDGTLDVRSGDAGYEFRATLRTLTTEERFYRKERMIFYRFLREVNATFPGIGRPPNNGFWSIVDHQGEYMAVLGTIQDLNTSVDTCVSKWSFGKTFPDQEEDAGRSGYNVASFSQHTVYLKYLSIRERKGDINEAEKWALKISRERSVNNQEGMFTYNRTGFAFEDNRLRRLDSSCGDGALYVR